MNLPVLSGSKPAVRRTGSLLVTGPQIEMAGRAIEIACDVLIGIGNVGKKIGQAMQEAARHMPK